MGSPFVFLCNVKLIWRHSYHLSIDRANLWILVVQNLSVSSILWPFLVNLPIVAICHIIFTNFFKRCLSFGTGYPISSNSVPSYKYSLNQKLFLTGKSWLRPNHTANSVTKLDVEITSFPGSKIVKGTIPKLKIIITFVSGSCS